MKKESTGKIKCQICNGMSKRVLTLLKDTPLEDNFTSKPNNLELIPLDSYCCTSCGLIFLKSQIDPSSSYSEYLYTSSTTVGLKSHFNIRAANLIDLYNIKKEDQILHLGCNDGSFLNSFKVLGYENLLGVEPAPEPVKIARKLGINIQQNYFNQEWVIKNNTFTPKLITANYMFANIPNPLDFMQACSKLMLDDSVFSVETGYHPSQFDKNMVDYIYHEHFFYFTIKTLYKMANKSNLKISSIRENNHKGGSIEVDFVKKDTNFKYESRELLNLYQSNEDKILSDFDKYYDSLDNRINKIICEIKAKLIEHFKSGGEIIAFGASHSTTTLLHLIKSENYKIKNIIDDNVTKQGRYSPSTNISVISPKDINNNNNNRLIICLAWQHSDSILKKYLGKLSENCWLIPFPEIKIIYPN
jgi:hypothetical protein